MLVTVVCAGVDKRDGQLFIGWSNSQGLKQECNWIATGFANYFCQVLLETNWRPDMTLQQAKELLDQCFKVMFWREKTGHDEIQFATVTIPESS